MLGSILSSNKYLLNTYAAPELILSTEDIAGNKTKFTSQAIDQKSK